MTYVTRITETEFDARVTEIEQEFDITLDDLGIEVQYVSHPEDADEEIASIRHQVAAIKKDTPAQILARWEQGFRRDAVTGAWVK